MRRHEAHVPAEQPSTRQDARLPHPDEHQGWAFGARCTPRQGPHPHLGLVAESFVLPRSRRIHRAEDFRVVLRGGSRASSRTVVVHAHQSGAAVPARAGFVVGRSVGGSVRAQPGDPTAAPPDRGSPRPAPGRDRRGRARPSPRRCLLWLRTQEGSRLRAAPGAGQAGTRAHDTIRPVPVTSGRNLASRARVVWDMTLGRVLSLVLIGGIRGYQRFISPLTGPTCRYHPTCSAYALGAVRTHGPVKGSLLAVGRLVRCNPWIPGRHRSCAGQGGLAGW